MNSEQQRSIAENSIGALLDFLEQLGIRSANDDHMQTRVDVYSSYLEPFVDRTWGNWVKIERKS